MLFALSFFSNVLTDDVNRPRFDRNVSTGCMAICESRTGLLAPPGVIYLSVAKGSLLESTRMRGDFKSHK